MADIMGAVRQIGGTFQGLVFVAIMVVVLFAVADQVISQGLIANTSTFYTDFTNSITKITSIVGVSLDILKLIVVVILLLSIIYYFASKQ